jgi:two-component system sensor histidine kinase KdpD
MPKQRLNPENILKRVQEEERQEQRGKLKIYLGAAPGVGKTYTMLQDAIAKRAQGLDVIIGVVESHDRSEVKSLLSNLEIIPPQKVEYHGRQLSEFNLDGALKRNPGLILIDEMAHTNIPGLRHSKRWQDIKELLDRGIDVYTTLNIQHVESLNDVISQIIHTRIKETVPDFMLELANTIELVDLPPEELLKRLQEGKVYFPQQANIAAENFFRKGNLIALRELALRTTAERVGEQVLLYRQGQGIQHIWPTKEKLLVCVGSHYASTKIIRSARRMAVNAQADWIAVHVDMPGIQNEEERRRAIQNLKLAEQLGADTKILSGINIVNEIMSYAREQNITKIVIGKRIRPRWKDLLFRSLADELVRSSGEIDISIVTNEVSDFTKPKPKTPSKSTIPWKIYGITLGVIALATCFNLLIYPYLHTSSLLMVYLLAVIIIALFGYTGPSLVASILSVLAYSFFFVQPVYSFSISDFQYGFTFIVILAVSQTISQLTILTKWQIKASRLAEKYTASLHTLSKQLASTRGVDKLLEVGVSYISEIFNSEIMALLSENGHLAIRAGYGSNRALNEKEQGVAQWVFDLGQTAGLGTDTLPFSDAVYIPLLTTQGTIGVLRVFPIEKNQLFTPEQMQLLEACANQMAVAIEVDRLQDQTRKSELEVETDRVRSTLLQSVSHDLHTPIVSILGSASTLVELGDELDARKIKRLGNDIYFEADQLNRLINNLLQITYFDAEKIKLHKIPHSLKNIVTLVIKDSAKKLGKKTINIHIPDDLPDIPLDERLIEEVFVNLIDNAIKFTPTESPINITATLNENNVVVCIEDRGPGIVPDEVNQLFEKFYRGRMLTSERGLGLGLAICRSIINAHGGKIWAENRADGGAVFKFTLPLSHSSL